MDNNQILKNKNIFISGSYGNLGEKISLGCAKYGANLILNGRNLEKLNSLKNKIKNKYSKINIRLANFDINSEKDIKNYFNKLNKLDVLINNAHFSKMGSLDEINSKNMNESFQTNAIAAINLSKYSVNLLKTNNKSYYSSIINISSIYGLLSPHIDIYKSKKHINSISYGVSKAAINQSSKYLAIDYAKYNIKVNSLILGPFPSKKYLKDHPNTSKKIKALIPMKRFGNSNDIIGPIIFLSSNLSNFVTGTQLYVDGGWSAW